MIEVGDRIRYTNGLGGRSVYTVHRVTKTRAYFRVNDRAEGCVRRKPGAFGLVPVPKPGTWDTARYELIEES